MQEIYKILRRIKERFDIVTDVELAALLGEKQNTISSWKSRGNVPYKKIIAFCAKHEIDKDLILGEGKQIETSALTKEMSEIVEILICLKEKDQDRFNLIKNLINDYKTMIGCNKHTTKEEEEREDLRQVGDELDYAI